MYFEFHSLTILTIYNVSYYTAIGIYAIGGFGLIALHGLKMRKITTRSSFSPLVETSVIECTEQSLQETEAHSEVSEESLDSSMIQTTPRTQPTAHRSSTSRRLGNRLLLTTAGSRYVRLADERGERASKSNKIADKEELSSYYQAFSALAKGTS